MKALRRREVIDHGSTLGFALRVVHGGRTSKNWDLSLKRALSGLMEDASFLNKGTCT